MAYTSTTLGAACGVTDTSIVVASATSVAAGNLLVIDTEVLQVGQGYASGTTVPVLRGRMGTATAAHANGAGVAQGIAAADWPNPGPGEVVFRQPARGAFAAGDLTATGATGSTATVVTTQAPAVITLTGASGAGVNLPTATAVPGSLYLFRNAMTGAAKIYAVGSTINGTTGTTAFTLTATGNLLAVAQCTVAGAWAVYGNT